MRLRGRSTTPGGRRPGSSATLRVSTRWASRRAALDPSAHDRGQRRWASATAAFGRWSPRPNDPLLSGLSRASAFALADVHRRHPPARARRAACASGAAQGRGDRGERSVRGRRWRARRWPAGRLPPATAVLAVLLATSSGRGGAAGPQGLARPDPPAARRHRVDRPRRRRDRPGAADRAGHGSLGRVLIGGVLVVASAAVLYVVVRVGRHPTPPCSGSGPGLGSGAGASTCGSRCWRCSRLAWVAVRFGTSILIAGFTMGTVVGAARASPGGWRSSSSGSARGSWSRCSSSHLGAAARPRARWCARRPPSALAIGLAVSAVAIHVVAAVVWRLPLGTRAARVGAARGARRSGLDRPRLPGAHPGAGGRRDGLGAGHAHRLRRRRRAAGQHPPRSPTRHRSGDQPGGGGQPQAMRPSSTG